MIKNTHRVRVSFPNHSFCDSNTPPPHPQPPPPKKKKKEKTKKKRLTLFWRKCGLGIAELFLESLSEFELYQIHRFFNHL